MGLVRIIRIVVLVRQLIARMVVAGKSLRHLDGQQQLI